MAFDGIELEYRRGAGQSDRKKERKKEESKIDR